MNIAESRDGINVDWDATEANIRQIIRSDSIRFTVLGTPRPQGSMRAFWKPGMQQPVVTSDNKKLKPWRQEMAATAMEYAQGRTLPVFGDSVPVEVTLNFYFSRPKSATEKKRPAMTVKPDSDKLLRAVLDSLKGILVHDDAQIIEFHVRKHYGGPDRVEIELREAIA